MECALYLWVKNQIKLLRGQFGSAFLIIFDESIFKSEPIIGFDLLKPMGVDTRKNLQANVKVIDKKTDEKVVQ